MDAHDSRRFAFVWLGVAAALAGAGSVSVSGFQFGRAVMLFGAPNNVILNLGVLFVCLSIAIGLTVVGIRMWADRRDD
jgi:TRAP-type C4-dicarboxylate transport system permease small subunit